MRSLPQSARWFIAACVAAAVTLLVVAVFEVTAWDRILLISAVYVGCISVSFGASGTHTSGLAVTVSTPIALTAVIVLGPWGGALVAASAILDLSHPSIVKRIFNTSQLVVAACLSGYAYQALGGEFPLDSGSFPRVLPAAIACGMVYLAVNVALVGCVVVLAENERWSSIGRDLLARVALPGIAYSALALVLAVLWSQVGALALVLGLFPLVIARWAMSQFAEEQEAYRATIRTLVQAVETKDAYTRGHSERVARASVLIAEQIEMSEERTQAVEYAGTLHDVGKLGVPTSVLQKSGKLTDDEFDAIKLHPVRGHDIVRDIKFLDEALEGIYHHHERIDGRGYPAGLQGMQIPEFARIIAVADAFDSMTSTRSYRGARQVDEAITELERCKGTQFDPAMVDALISAVKAAGWVSATPPTAEELSTQAGVSTIDDDDPLLDVKVSSS